MRLVKAQARWNPQWLLAMRFIKEQLWLNHTTRMVWGAHVDYRGCKSLSGIFTTFLWLLHIKRERDILLLEKVNMDQQTFYSLIFTSVFLNITICLLDDDRFLTTFFFFWECRHSYVCAFALQVEWFHCTQKVSNLEHHSNNS